MVIAIPSTAKMWKYLSIALMGLLATGFLAPQAFAHVTSNLQHNLEHVVNFLTGIDTKVTLIKTKVDANLDATVSSRAAQTSVDNMQTTANMIKAKTDNIPTEPASNIQIIRDELSDSGQLTSVCTSTEPFKLYIAYKLGSSSLVSIASGGDEILSSSAGGSGTFIVGGEPNESLTVRLTGGSPVSGNVIVTMETTSDAVAGCSGGPSTIHTLTVRAETGDGSPLSVVANVNGTTGTTPASFTLNNGQPYILSVPSTSGSLVFDRWSDGPTTASRPISITANATRTAVYTTAP